MEEILKKPMMVMEMRPEFSIQYKANPKLKLKIEDLKTKKSFQSFLSKTAKNWKQGNYFLRSDVGPFAGFNLKKGGKVTLKKETNNSTPYLCWSYIGKKEKK
jgi:hypothetical protein